MEKKAMTKVRFTTICMEGGMQHKVAEAMWDSMPEGTQRRLLDDKENEQALLAVARQGLTTLILY